MQSYNSWDETAKIFFQPKDYDVLAEMNDNKIPLPEYLVTVIKKSNMGDKIMMSWPSKNVLIFYQDVDENTFASCKYKGWSAYRIYEIDYVKLSKELE